MKIRLGHSPDADDAFMWSPLANKEMDSGKYEIEHVIEDIETLNQRSLKGELEVTALSIHTYALVADKYALTNCGASMGLNYGPVLVTVKQGLDPKNLSGKTVGIPGRYTSAYLATRLYFKLEGLAEPEYKFLAFDAIDDAVKTGEIDAGVLIHEGQLTYEGDGFNCLVDLGKWWFEYTDGLPLPLGGNAIRRDMGDDIAPIVKVLEQCLTQAMDNHESSLKHAMKYARGLPEKTADDFIKMYVNESTLDYGDKGREAVKKFLDLAHEHGIIENKVDVTFV